MKRVQTSLIIWGVLSTIAVFYFWNANQRQEKVNTLLTESISLHKKVIANEVKSYYAIDDCFVVNRGLCNAEEFKNKLQILGDESYELYSQISLLETELNKSNE